MFERKSLVCVIDMSPNCTTWGHTMFVYTNHSQITQPDICLKDVTSLSHARINEHHY